jgi:hypothetical protein
VAGAAACSHTPVNCDDNNACTADTCNATNGLCEHGAPTNCDDGNACTADSCNTTTGLCEHGTPPSCDDGNACTADSCNTSTGLCEHGAPPSCDDNNPCTDDSCNTTSGSCQNVPNDNPACAPAICRTPGFWGTHGGVSLQVIGLAGGCLDVCGEVIKDINVNSADSVLEAICVSPRGEQRLQLARQLTSMALNCVISGFGSDCGGNANLDQLFGSCNSSCLGLPNSPSVGDCISAVDCFNNGGSLDAQGLCEFDDNNNCHNRALPATLNQGPADTPQQCNAARGNACEIILSGEASCATGTKSSSPETCP